MMLVRHKVGYIVKIIKLGNGSALCSTPYYKRCWIALSELEPLPRAE